ncbi:MAG: tRNA (N(6)-L-threonylcarbamoyladenosine(37)-C(2))-methylthiotransferase MtaB [Bacteroidales bacterium]|nr:tRNA (N(6)-L-threonylcarbamoyladenosine(37)-C(2))-methylthiotransferase MtaB [Bacteroidales bacterium]MDY0217047.1 tRNA (N(6)-L-threonylcarbamoyladenosine(37)-C(2))-methylthiotransferase MtaB [Bacteroidales bacterium]
MKTKIAFHTLGCKLNYSETSYLSKLLDHNTFEETDFKEKADVYVINTCTVTSTAEKKCRSFARSARKRNPQSKIVFMGCYSELKAKELQDSGEIDLIIGSSNKFELPELLSALVRGKQEEIVHVDKNAENSFFSSWSSEGRTRTFLKIQDGCDYFCAYCAVPLARGASRSDTIENVIKNAKEIVAQDIKEIVLTGVNIGDFGRKNDQSFYILLKQLSDIDGLERVRISSIEPNLLTDEIIELVAQHPKLMPHFHIPLQSAHPRILKEMKRRYSLELFSEKINKIKQLLPDACIAIDLICGFPGETEQDFEESVEYLTNINITYLHVFPYSVRANTVAEKLSNHLLDNVKKERSKILHTLSDYKKNIFYSSQIGSIHDVLFEDVKHDNMISGFTENYIRVKTNYNKELANTIAMVKLKQIDTDGVYVCELI